MRIEVAGRLKDRLAVDAVVMTLSVVSVQTKIVLEQLAAWSAVRVIIVIMDQKVIIITKMFVATLTVEMVRALHVVLLQIKPHRKINAAAVAYVMGTGILLMLVESMLIGEPSVTAVTVNHCESTLIGIRTNTSGTYGARTSPEP